MEQNLCFLKPELWYPYSEPRVNPDAQVAKGDQDDFADSSTDRSDHPRLVGLVLGS
jgi:hypothetical protein